LQSLLLRQKPWENSLAAKPFLLLQKSLGKKLKKPSEINNIAFKKKEKRAPLFYQ